jgi:H+/Cl- antiporter ClcA
MWEFEEWQCLVAFVIGVVCAALSLVIIIFVGITKQIFNRIRHRLDDSPFLAKVVPPVIAGVAIGLVNWALPLTVGNGNQVLLPILRYGYRNQLSQKLLICTAFSRIFLLAISMNSGFVGGFIFPIIAIGVIAGVVGYQMYPGCPLGLMVGCFMAALPASICPMPMTLCGIAIYSFFFGLYQTVPIFIATIVSYTLIVGTGLFTELQKRGNEAKTGESISTSYHLIAYGSMI